MIRVGNVELMSTRRVHSEEAMAERGRTTESVIQQYLSTVRPMHMAYVEPSKRWADIIIPEGGENKVALEMVVARLEQILGG